MCTGFLCYSADINFVCSTLIQFPYCFFLIFQRTINVYVNFSSAAVKYLYLIPNFKDDGQNLLELERLKDLTQHMT